MESKLLTIKEIVPTKKNFGIKVKVNRMWVQNGNGADSDKKICEVILMDEQGSKIGMHVRPKQLKKAEKGLNEDSNYIIRNLFVAQNKYPSKHWAHKYKLMCTLATSFIPTDEWAGAGNPFNLVPFTDINPTNMKADVSVDVIGRLSGIGEIKPYHHDNGNTSKSIIIDIQDLDGKRLSCTLWNDYVDQFNVCYSNKDPGSFLVMVIQNAKTRYYLDSLALSTDWNATRLLLNQTDPIITEFRSRVVDILGSPETVSDLGPAVTQSYLTQKNFFDDCQTIGLDEITPSNRL